MLRYNPILCFRCKYFCKIRRKTKQSSLFAFHPQLKCFNPIFFSDPTMSINRVSSKSFSLNSKNSVSRTKSKSGMVTRGIAYLATDTPNNSNGNGIFLTISALNQIEDICLSETSLQVEIRCHVKSKIGMESRNSIVNHQIWQLNMRTPLGLNMDFVGKILDPQLKTFFFTFSHELAYLLAFPAMQFHSIHSRCSLEI